MVAMMLMLTMTQSYHHLHQQHCNHFLGATFGLRSWLFTAAPFFLHLGCFGMDFLYFLQALVALIKASFEACMIFILNLLYYKIASFS